MARVVCVDPSVERAKKMADKFGAARAVANHEQIIDEIDGAIIAVPARLHYQLGISLLSEGVHVLCEKPLAENGREARALVEKAGTAGVALCVNNYRRLYPSSLKVHSLIARGELGTIRYLEYWWGEQFDWPTASGAYFGAAAGGRGVLSDKGSHILDLVCWWIGGKPEIVSYQDDAMGGTEAVAHLHFRRGECEGHVRFSWLSRYRNTFSIKGDRASLAGGLFDWDTVDLKSAGGRTTKLRLPSDAKVPQDVGETMLENFVEVVSGQAQPLVTGVDVLPSIELIDECYAARTRLPASWHDAWQRIAG